MRLKNKIYWLMCFICVAFLCCNTTNHSKKSVENSLALYDHLILKLDADSIALLYAPDGKLGTIATGRDSIRKFLSSFNNVQVLFQHSTSNFVKISKDTAYQKGKYKQVDVVSAKDTLTVNGAFTIKWEWSKNDGWHIKEMNTKSLN